MTLQLRQCPRCKEEKPISEFYFHKGKRTGLTVYCKPCHKEETNLSRDRTTIKRKIQNIDRLNDNLDHIAVYVDHVLNKKQRILNSITKEGSYMNYG